MNLILTSKQTMKDLTKGSRKKITIKCDYCERVFRREYRRQLKIEEENIIEKDFCVECRSVKNAEVYLRSIRFNDIEKIIDEMVINNSSIISGVYAIRNRNTNKSYIGSSKDIIHRWKNHFQKEEKRKHYINEFRNISLQDIEFIVLDYGTKHDVLVDLEYKYIQLFKTNDPKYGYNTYYRKIDTKSNKDRKMPVQARLNRAKLSLGDVKGIKMDLYDGLSMKKISEKYDTSYSNIQNIKSLRSWENVLSHLNSFIKNIKYDTGHIGSNNPDSKLTEEDVRYIKLLLEKGKRTMASIAREYEVSGTLISHIKHGRLWKHVV